MTLKIFILILHVFDVKDWKVNIFVYSYYG